MKGYDVTVDLPNLPKGAEVQVNGLGILRNGETAFVTQAQADHWREMNATLAHEYDDKGQLVTKTVKSRTLAQTLGKVRGFEVVKAEAPELDSSTVEGPQTEIDTQEQLPLDEQKDDGGDE